MSGPSLRKPDAHSSIHEAALNEALELRNLVQKCLHDGEKEKALEVLGVTIEHWETRTLKHAEAEEEGLYRDIVKDNPELEHTVIQLTRDHDLMRRIVENIKVRLQTQEPDNRMITLLDSLVIIDEIHNEDEMNKLLAISKR
ncbi:hemerythrin domain-containing protein [Neobacillus sp. MM2021_6]|uniref:hemerythrin domain-containing protein n=1 Tax=Bacillaceae TaxID=186817 RepID=UPI00140A99BE|nr:MULTISPECIES: hemerythrin domain-containing protein [Bacillaceae]MBO0961726.1 hemerythrin domain-containing protein [Neobacillus sp. MM2021_6]NHC18317.1 hemerythrin domain-containing protein [Bacillus sp. MM2020_4]